MRLAPRVAVGLLAAVAVSGCIVLIDFDEYETRRYTTVTSGDAALVEPFVIASVSPTEIPGRTGDAVKLVIGIERRLGFAGTITFGIANANDLRLEAAPLAGSAGTIEATLTLGSVQGERVFDLTATSVDAPGYTARVTLRASVRGAPGTFDTSFGKEGIIEIPTLSQADDVVAGEKRILVAGRGFIGAQDQGFIIAALDERGRPDPSFGDGGAASLDTLVAGNAVGSCVRFAGDGVLAAAMSGTPPRLHVSRLDGSGHPEPSYGDGGTTTISEIGASSCTGLQTDERGALLVTDFMMYRRTLTGAADLAFGDAGAVPLTGGARLAGSDNVIDLVGFDESGIGHLRFTAAGAPLDQGQPPAMGLPPGGCVAIHGSERTPDGRVFANVDCTNKPPSDPAPPTEATLLAFTDRNLEPSFNDGGPLMTTDESVAVALTRSSEGLIAITRRFAIEPSIVRGYGYDGRVRWTLRSSTTPSLKDLTIVAASVDPRGRVVLVGNFLNAGDVPIKAFIARVWD